MTVLFLIDFIERPRVIVKRGWTYEPYWYEKAMSSYWYKMPLMNILTARLPSTPPFKILSTAYDAANIQRPVQQLVLICWQVIKDQSLGYWFHKGPFVYLLCGSSSDKKVIGGEMISPQCAACMIEEAINNARLPKILRCNSESIFNSRDIFVIAYHRLARRLCTVITIEEGKMECTEVINMAKATHPFWGRC